jgi:hypothetical protein
MIERIFGHTANAVAAHFRFRTVGIEHPHPHISLVGWQNQNQPIPADPEMPIGDSDCGARWIGHRLIKAVDVDVVVADSVHFRETHDAISIATNPSRRRAQFTGA